MMPETGYARYTRQASRNTFSTEREVPLTTSRHTPNATIGTNTYFDSPKIPSPAATPANSARIFPKFATSSSSMTRKAARTPNCSRIRSASPLPVTTPMRAHISCTTISAARVGGRVHRSAVPKWAPARE